jgi:WD40 repeat protein
MSRTNVTGMSSVSTAAGGPATRVFVSYSRKDAAALAVLRPGLESRGYEVLLDAKDIAPAEVWRARLDALILQADAVIFLVSPDSILSEVCRWEIDQTLAYGKKLIPVLWRETDPATCPPAIAERNWIAAPAAEAIEAFDQGVMTAVASALETDIDWERERSHWLSRALRWEGSGQGVGLLLRAEEAVLADAWAARRPIGAAELPELLLAFFERSREQVRAERDRLRSISGRAFVRPVQQAVEDGAPDRALRMVATACVLAEDPDFELVPDVWRAAALALDQQPVWAWGDTYDGPAPLVCAAVAEDGGLAVISTPNNALLLFDSALGQERWRVQRNTAFLRVGLMSTGDVWAVLAGGDLERFDGQTGQTMARHALGADAAEGVFDRLTSAFCFADGTDIQRLDLLTGETETLAEFERPAQLVAYQPSAECGIAVLDSEVEWTDTWVFGPGWSTRLVVMSSPNLGAVSADGSVAAITSGGDIHLIDARTGAELAVCSHPGGVTSVALNGDGTQLVSGGGDGAIRLWDQQGRELKQFDLGRAARIPKLAFSADGWAVLAMTQTTAFRWSLTNDEKILIVADHPIDGDQDRERTGIADFGTFDGGVWALLKCGLLQAWSKTRPEITDLRPLLADGTPFPQLLARGSDGALVILAEDRLLQERDGLTMTVNLQGTTFPEADAGAVWAAGSALNVVAGGVLTSVDLVTGAVRWRAETPAKADVIAVAAATGQVLVADEGARIWHPDGTEIGTTSLRAAATAAIWSGTRQAFIVGTREGDLLGLGCDGASSGPIPLLPGAVTSLFERVDGTLWALSARAIWNLAGSDWQRVCDLAMDGQGLFVAPSVPLACVMDATVATFIDLQRMAAVRTIQTFNLLDQRCLGRCMSPDGSSLVSLGRRGRLRRWDTADLLQRVADPAGGIATLLSRGRDIPRASERTDILMRDRPDDLLDRLHRLRPGTSP